MTGTGTLADPVLLEVASGDQGVPWSTAPAVTDAPTPTEGDGGLTRPAWWFKADPAVLGGTVLNAWMSPGDLQSSDAVMEIYTGDPAAPASMVLVASGDDYGSAYMPRVENLALSEPVYIRVSPYWYDPADPTSPPDTDGFSWDVGTANWLVRGVGSRQWAGLRQQVVYAAAPPLNLDNSGAWNAQGRNQASQYQASAVFDAEGITMGLAGSAYVHTRAIHNQLMDITGGLTVEFEITRYQYLGFGVFFLRPEYNDYNHMPYFGQDVQSIGWQSGGAGASVSDSAYHNKITIWEALTPTANGQLGTAKYTSSGNSPMYGVPTTSVCKVTLTPTGAVQKYTLAYTRDGYTWSAEVTLPDQVWVGIGHGQHYSYSQKAVFKKVKVANGVAPTLGFPVGMDVDVEIGVADSYPATIAPTSLLQLVESFTAPGRTMAEMVPASVGAPALAMTLRGDYELTNPSYNPADYEKITPRVLQGFSLDIPTPAVAHGKPVVPTYWFTHEGSAFTANAGAFQVIPDPPPPPLYVPVGAGTWRWVPATAQVAENDWIENWPPVGGDGPVWHSLFPYRPRKRPYVQVGTGGRQHTYNPAVIHDPNFVEHIWIDLGKDFAQPFTWIFCTIITSWPMPRQHILDTGNALPRSTIAAVRRDRTFSEPGPRALAVADRSSFTVATGDPNAGVFARSGHHSVARPRVFFAVFNGSDSYAGVWDNRYRSIVKGRVGPSAPRRFVMGRRNGAISDQLALKGVTLEVRFVEGRALTTGEMEAQYGQLATAYNFAIN